MMVSCSWDKTISIWDLNSGECLKILRGHETSVSSMAVISDEKIISGSYCEIKVWDFESGACLQTLNIGHIHYIHSIIKIINAKIASCDHSGKIIIWNKENGELLKIIDAHSDSIYSLKKLSDKKNKNMGC